VPESLLHLGFGDGASFAWILARWTSPDCHQLSGCVGSILPAAAEKLGDCRPSPSKEDQGFQNRLEGVPPIGDSFHWLEPRQDLGPWLWCARVCCKTGGRGIAGQPLHARLLMLRQSNLVWKAIGKLVTRQKVQTRSCPDVELLPFKPFPFGLGNAFGRTWRTRV